MHASPDKEHVVGATYGLCPVWAVQSLYNCNSLQPSGHYMYHQFNIRQFYVLPAQCIYVFCVDLRTLIISLYSIN